MCSCCWMQGPPACRADSTAAVWGQTAIYMAAKHGHTEIVWLLLTASHVATEDMVDLARVALAAGRARLAAMLLKALMSRDMPAAAALFAGQENLACEALKQWQAAEVTLREQEAC